MAKFRPYDSHKDALGTLLDLIQYRRVKGDLKLTDEEHVTFMAALRYHDHHSVNGDSII